jgi:hypothetical protein
MLRDLSHLGLTRVFVWNIAKTLTRPQTFRSSKLCRFYPGITPAVSSQASLPMGMLKCHMPLPAMPMHRVWCIFTNSSGPPPKSAPLLRIVRTGNSSFIWVLIYNGRRLHMPLLTLGIFPRLSCACFPHLAYRLFLSATLRCFMHVLSSSARTVSIDARVTHCQYPGV